MSELTAAKSWALSTWVDPARRLTFDLGSNTLSASDATSPVEHMLAAVGACFAQTCAALVQHHRLDPTGIRVAVQGHKPAGPLMGKGLNKIEIDVSFERDIGAVAEVQILKDAKKLCTVTNSLSKDIEMVIRGPKDRVAG